MRALVIAGTIALLLVLLAAESEAHAGDRTGATRRLHLATPELFAMLGSSPTSPQLPSELIIGDIVDRREAHESGLPPFFTLVAPQSPETNQNGGSQPPLLAFGARVRGTTLVIFTRPGTKIDPDDSIVYQRLVVSDLFERRRVSVTVFEDHVLGSSDNQILGFGARLMLRPTLEILGWRTRVELFASYDLTEGAMGYLGITARSPTQALQER